MKIFVNIFFVNKHGTESLTLKVILCNCLFQEIKEMVKQNVSKSM